ncbi:hypothetical protein BH10ACT1_BH10ACT1_33930 [soil metagenome]
MLAPIAPAATGNGLAMRCHAVVRAAALHHEVVLVVVPVAGSVRGAPEPADAYVTRFDLAPSARGDRRPLLAWMADPAWRDRLAALAPLPDAVAAAAPSRASEVIDLLGNPDVAGVVAVRLSLAPLALAVAERLGAPLVVDADDDDVAFHLRAQDPDAADRWRRVGAVCLPSARLVLVASGTEQASVAERWHLGDRVVVVPNAVDLPPVAASPAGGHRLLLVGNLTYGPNVAGARWLVEEVLPLLPATWQIDLVGAPGAPVSALAGERVAVRGWVAEVTSSYAGTTVVAVPLHAGSGTRIKVLEAFAHGRPVVSTTVGAEGIAARHDEHLLLADDPATFARAVLRAAEPTTAVRLTAAARALVARAYAADDVATRLGDLLAGVTGADVDGHSR